MEVKGTKAAAALATTSHQKTPASDSKAFGRALNGALSQQGSYDELFAAAGEKYNLPAKLLKAVAKAESNFNSNAVSSAGAQGIMQLMPGTARELGVQNAFDPAENIFAGAHYLRKMLDRFGGDISLALAAYNAGPGNVAKYNGIPPFAETQKYVQRVLALAETSAEQPVLDLSPQKPTQPLPDTRETALNSPELLAKRLELTWLQPDLNLLASEQKELLPEQSLLREQLMLQIALKLHNKDQA